MSATPAADGRPLNLRRVEASAYLKNTYGISIAATTLAKLACLGAGGPAFYKAGVTPLYPVSSLDEWAKAHLGRLRVCTSEHSSDQVI